MQLGRNLCIYYFDLYTIFQVKYLRKKNVERYFC